jgi:hypothetical protein
MVPQATPYHPSKPLGIAAMGEEVCGWLLVLLAKRAKPTIVPTSLL